MHPWLNGPHAALIMPSRNGARCTLLYCTVVCNTEPVLCSTVLSPSTVLYCTVLQLWVAHTERWISHGFFSKRPNEMALYSAHICCELAMA